MKKYITIEIPEGYNRLLSISLIGTSWRGPSVFTSSYDLALGTYLTLDKFILENEDKIHYNQLSTCDGKCVLVDAEELNRLQLLENAVIEACKKEKEE